jgi:dipeptidyl aminopeptidase/acylaminoacyl peptidase
MAWLLGLEIGVDDAITTWMFGGHPWEVPDRYTAARDLIRRMKRATTPTLFLMGSPDHNGIDETRGVQAMYTALRLQGVPTTYVYYPDEGHGFRAPANDHDSIWRTIEWIDSYLKP